MKNIKTELRLLIAEKLLGWAMIVEVEEFPLWVEVDEIEK